VKPPRYRVALMLNLIGADWEPIFVDFFKSGETLCEGLGETLGWWMTPLALAACATG
jgi:hypothetical protein